MTETFLSRMKRVMMAVITLAAMTACGGGGTGAVPPPAPLQVTAVAFDADAAGVVFLNSAVAVTFSGALDAASVSPATVTLTAGGATVAGTFTVSGATALFRPAAALAAGTTCTLTVTTGVRNSAGTPLAAPFTQSFTTGTTTDATPPVVAATSPAAGATGAGVGAITVTFSKFMDISSFTAATFSLTGGGAAVSGSFAMNGKSVIFSPDVSLAANTTYTATVAAGVKDLAGNPLGSAFSFTFTTGTVILGVTPRVVSVSPADNATGVAASATVSVTFSVPMDPATITASTFALTSGAGPVPGTVGLDATGTVATFRPTASLATDTRYTASVTTGAKSAAGVPLPAIFTWSFATVSGPPAVVTTAPAAGATGVTTNSALVVTFSKAMDPATVTTSTFTLAGPAGAVAGTVSLDATGKIATFLPAAALAAATTYTATVTSGVKDQAGAALPAPFAWSFTTGTGPSATAPTVAATTPVNGATNVSLTVPDITATFSTAMDPATITNLTFTLTAAGVPVQGTVTLNGSIARFTPVAPIQASTLHRATVSSGVKDLAGNALAVPFSWSFTTAPL